MAMLRRVVLNGFKSVKAMDLELRSLNVLIGANGAGKSNLISFFKMLNEMMGGRLQTYIATSGQAQSLLHFGPKVTPQLEARLEFEVDNGVDIYSMRLFHAAVDRLIFAEETLAFHASGFDQPKVMSLGSGHVESRITESAESGEPTSRVIRRLLNRCRVYHFHDTSSTARVRQSCYVGDTRWLMHDAYNLAPVLRRLRDEADGRAYRAIVSTIRMIAPFFDDFDLEPSDLNKSYVSLNWREKGADQLFGPHQLSDGTLRAMCLITLLMLPEDELPNLIVVDEPELGLHPYALNVVASLFQRAAHHTQVVVSTQSSSFLDNFDPGDIVVVSRDGKDSRFERPDAAELEEWLDEYSLGEVWAKNVIGGGPH